MPETLKEAIESLVTTWAKFPLKSDECANATLNVIKQFEKEYEEEFNTAFEAGLI